MTIAVWAWLLVIARVAPIAWWAPPGDDAPVVVRAALGLTNVPPAAIALPLKLLLFVAIDGWRLLAEGLLRGYA